MLGHKNHSAAVHRLPRREQHEAELHHCSLTALGSQKGGPAPSDCCNCWPPSRSALQHLAFLCCSLRADHAWAQCPWALPSLRVHSSWQRSSVFLSTALPLRYQPAQEILTCAAAFISFGPLTSSSSSKLKWIASSEFGSSQALARGPATSPWPSVPLRQEGAVHFHQTTCGPRMAACLLVCRSGVWKAIPSGTFNSLGLPHWWFYHIWKLLLPSSHSSLQVTV